LAEPLGSAEPRLKNTALRSYSWVAWVSNNYEFEYPNSSKMLEATLRKEKPQGELAISEWLLRFFNQKVRNQNRKKQRPPFYTIRRNSGTSSSHGENCNFEFEFRLYTKHGFETV